MSSQAGLQLQVTVTTDQHWLKLHAGSEYDKEWERYFSLREEARVTKLAEAIAAEAELLESALKWRSATGGQRLLMVLVLHKERSRLIRAPGQGRRQHAVRRNGAAMDPAHRSHTGSATTNHRRTD